jgi:KRAB domain-containing zinc finger protein
MEYFEELKEYYNYDIDIIEQTSHERFICDECGQSYKYYSGLYSHKRKHDPVYKNKYSCSVCQYSSDNIHHLYSHINTHEEATIITNERKLYRKPNKHRKSKINENDKNIFSCPICDKKYNYKQSMQVHLKTHDVERVFKFMCELCDFKCDHKAQFNRHKKSHYE